MERDTLSEEVTLSLWLYLTLKKKQGSVIKGKNLLPWGANSFCFRVNSFRSGLICRNANRNTNKKSQMLSPFCKMVDTLLGISKNKKTKKTKKKTKQNKKTQQQKTHTPVETEYRCISDMFEEWRVSYCILGTLPFSVVPGRAIRIPKREEEGSGEVNIVSYPSYCLSLAPQSGPW